MGVTKEMTGNDFLGYENLIRTLKEHSFLVTRMSYVVLQG
jgi:hypothetical protein